MRTPGHRQAARAGLVVNGPVDPGHVRHADPADDAPQPGGQRQVEDDRVVGQRGDQRAQVAEQPGRGGVEDVVGADPAGHQVGRGGQLGQLVAQHVADQRARGGQVEHPPRLAGAQPQFGQHLADVTAVRGERAEALRGRVAQHHPERAAVVADPVVVRLPVAGERGAVAAQRGHSVGPPAEPALAQPGYLRGLGADQVGGRIGHDLDRGAARAAGAGNGVQPGGTGYRRQLLHPRPPGNPGRPGHSDERGRAGRSTAAVVPVYVGLPEALRPWPRGMRRCRTG